MVGRDKTHMLDTSVHDLTTAHPPSPAGELVEANVRLERRVGELLAVQDLALTVAAELRLDALLEAAVATIASLTGAHAVSILLPEPDGNGLTVRARRGDRGGMSAKSAMFQGGRNMANLADIPVVGGASLPRAGRPSAPLRAGSGPAHSEGLSGWVARHRVPLLLADVEARPEFAALARAEGYQGGSFVGVPLLFEERLVGVVCVAERAGGLAFHERDLRVLICLAPHLAIAIRNATLYEEMEALRRHGQPACAPESRANDGGGSED